MFETSTLLASALWGGIGSGFFIYGWKQKSSVPLAIGGALVGISYFISSALYMSLAAAAIFVVWYWLKKQGY
jgi:hypothetical protein